MPIPSRQPNREQQLVIDDLDNNIILFASAGTGKTFSVAKHVAKIIESGRALPEEILCLTFTIKAANEMKDDILEYVGENGKNVNASTIHSFCYHVLREERKRSGVSFAEPGVCDETDEGDMLSGIVASIIGEEQAKSMHMCKNSAKLTSVMSLLKIRREADNQYSHNTADDFTAVFDSIVDDNLAALQKTLTFFERGQKKYDNQFMEFLRSHCGRWASDYDNLMQQSNLLDFDDLICQTHRTLKQKDAADYWRSRYKYIIIDEMQDTNELEYDTLKTILAGNKVLMCGDFFQTIYEWRGSNPSIILSKYISEFSAKKHMFSENYRATQLLTRATFGYLQNTYPNLLSQYCPPNITAMSSTIGEKITSVSTGTIENEALWIYDYLERHMPEDPTKVCIMSRSNTYISSLYSNLAKISEARKNGRELRFFTVDKDSKFFRKAVIKDILAFLRLLQNKTDISSLNRVVEKYTKGVGASTLKTFCESGLIGVSSATFIDDETHRCGDPYAQLVEASQNDNIVIYDTETTGLDLGKDQIIQISALRLNSLGEIADTLDLLVTPTIPISKAAEATHHKSLEYIQQNGGLPIAEALKRFSEFVDGAVLVGHNSIRFDAPLVSRQLKECELPQLSILAEYDTMVIAKMFLPQLLNYKLDTLCSHYGIVNENAHDALGDITATGKALFAMLDAIKDTKLERMAFISKHIDKFKKLHVFLHKLNGFLQAGEITELIRQIIDTCDIPNRYSETTNKIAVNDLLYAVSNSNTEDGPKYVRELLTDSALSGSQIDLLIKKLHKIPIITVHQSKGCEFDTVIIAGMDNMNFPTYAAVQGGNEAEEKRVFYVAISRAKQKLIMTFAPLEGYYGRSLSPYVNKIPQSFIEHING